MSVEGESSEARDGCHSGTVSHPVPVLPWNDTARDSDKTELWKYVVNAPEGTPLGKIVGDVFGETEAGSADYQLTRRFFERYEDLFETTRRRRELWVEPTTDAFHLRQQYADRKTARGNDDDLSCAETGEKLEQAYPKDRVNRILGKQTRLDGNGDRHDYRAELLRELATHKASVEDRYTIFERVRGDGKPYLLVPYRDRFSDVDRAEQSRERFLKALKNAGGKYDNAVLLTVTCDPKRFGSISEAIEEIGEAKGRLMSWLSTDYQLGFRPENMTVLEWQDNGLPHYHILLFGATWIVGHDQLVAKWSDLGIGEVVHAKSVATRGSEATDWFMHRDRTTQTVRDYLGKSLDDLSRVAEMSGKELREQAENGNLDYWKQALYFATERQYVTCSPGLKPDNTGNDLPHVTVWSFVTVATWDDLPAHVTESARIDRPPP